MASQTPDGGRFPHLPGSPEQQGLPVRGLFLAPGEENFICHSVKIEVFHILLPQFSIEFEKMQGKNEVNLKKIIGKIIIFRLFYEIFFSISPLIS
jgi:hypothetical protein